MSLGIGNDACLIDDKDCRQWKSPTSLRRVLVGPTGIHERNVDEDRLVVPAVGRRHGIGNTETLSYFRRSVREDRKRQTVLLQGEVILALRLGRDRDEERASLG